MNGLPLSSRDALDILALVGAGAAFVAAERKQKLDALDGLWWAFATVTTVGYGDIAPKTRVGRAIAAGLMVQRLFSDRREASTEHRELRGRLDEIVRRLDAIDATRS